MLSGKITVIDIAGSAVLIGERRVAYASPSSAHTLSFLAPLFLSHLSLPLPESFRNECRDECKNNKPREQHDSELLPGSGHRTGLITR